MKNKVYMYASTCTETNNNDYIATTVSNYDINYYELL